MALKAGTHRGPYEILSQVGAGGMGEVYKARDTRLNRVVAIKVLPPHLADRPDVRERFEREARTIAALSHPHICVLYDVGEEDGAYFLVMEHVEGETLAARLERGPLPVDQVLRYASELADALDRAHRHGALHRDIKPANIMITRAGSKLLDFGLAKLKEAGRPDIFLSQRRTESNVLTDQGMILGTLHYMAPEQVEGRVDELDARTDIFAFGAVVYEMATGTKAFSGKSQASVMAAILKEDPPPMSSLQPMTPPALDRAVRKCLAKEPERRWQTASDLRDELKWIADGGAEKAVAPPARKRRNYREFVAWGVAGAAVLAATALAVPFFRAPSTSGQLIRFSIAPPSESAIGTMPLAVSRDGTRVAFGARDENGSASLIWVRSLDSPTHRPLPGTEGVSSLFWSPDGAFIGFVAGGKLKTVPVAGGPVRVLADAYPRGGTWNPEGTLVFTPNRNGGLARISSAGGTATVVTIPNVSRGEHAHRFPQFLPDGRHFLFLADTNDEKTCGVYVGSLDSTEPKRVLTTDLNVSYTTPGYLLFVQGRALMAQPFDADRFELSGEPSVVADGIAINQTANTATFSVSEHGVLAYASEGANPTRLTWFDRAGKDLGVIEAPAGASAPELSPDGNRMAVEVGGGSKPNDIWLLELARGMSNPLTTNSANERHARWSPDGRRVLFQSNREGGVYQLYEKPSSGAGTEELLFRDAVRKYPTDWSSDGKFVAYTGFGFDAATTADLWILPMAMGRPESADTRKPVPYLRTGFDETQARISPDMRWMAYVSNESTRDEVYISTFPTAGDRVPVSTSGGIQPRWRRDAKELFYLSRGRIMAVPLGGGPTLDVGAPTALFGVRVQGPGNSSSPYRPYFYDVTADGQRFVVNVPTAGEALPITVVLNWTAGLKK